MSAPSESHNEPVSIAIRIGRARPTLTRSHQQMADYVMAHPLQAATMPIDELAAAVGVSVATANRFARAIGDWCVEECGAVRRHARELQSHSPFRDDASP